MKTMPGETVILTTNDDILTLTNRRVRLKQSVAGQDNVVSMTLDAVSSCGLIMRSRPLLLALAVLAVLFGIWRLSANPYERDTGYLALVGGAALLAAYVFFRSAVLRIASAGESIFVSARGMKRDQLLDFIDSVEAAKIKYAERGAALR